LEAKKTMMNVCHNEAIIINGYSVTGGNGGNFTAQNEKVSIFFLAEGRDGGLYTKVTGYYDKVKDRRYNGQRYLYKYICPIQAIGFYLADNNYLWDYVQQRPFIEAREDAKRKHNEQRAAEGKKPIYDLK
jgi:hypothetical protein